MMVQKWIKKNLILPPELSAGQSHITLPVVIKLHDFIRVIYSSRDENGRSLPYYLDYDIQNNKVIERGSKPLLALGNLGSFDCDGVMPSCVLKVDDEYRMYYIGWNRGTDVPFRNSIGLAISHDLRNWKKAFEGPILDRGPLRPYFTASADVIKTEAGFTMYFLNCTGWEKSENGMKHHYQIQIGTSDNGIYWKDEGKVAIGFRNDLEYAISRPCVIQKGDKWHMWYSYRASEKSPNYKIGYARSDDGVNWIREDEHIFLDQNLTNWESEMQCYPCVFEWDKSFYMLYNGNGYGKTGVGLAILNELNG